MYRVFKMFKRNVSLKTESNVTTAEVVNGAAHVTVKKVLGNESGLTLIEIMVVSVIAVVLGLAIAEMQSQQAKSTKRLEIKTSAQDFYNVLKFQIVNSAVQTANQN